MSSDLQCVPNIYIKDADIKIVKIFWNTLYSFRSTAAFDPSFVVKLCSHFVLRYCFFLKLSDNVNTIQFK